MEEPSFRVRRPSASVSAILKVIADAARGRRPNGASQEENIEDKVRELFGKICAPKRYVGYVYYGPNDIAGTPLLEHGDRQYPLGMAATGEQVILDYLTQFVYPRPVNNSLILIDEPELHLHPRWIRQLYRALPLMGRGNQFIMTTHSPELRQLAAEDNAIIDLGQLGEQLGGPAMANQPLYPNAKPVEGDVLILCEGDVLGYESALLKLWADASDLNGRFVKVMACGTATALYGMADAVGRTVPVIVIEDRDFRTHTEAKKDCDKHFKNREGRNVAMRGWFAWQRAEIENYFTDDTVLPPVFADLFSCDEDDVRDAVRSALSLLFVSQALEYALYRV